MINFRQIHLDQMTGVGAREEKSIMILRAGHISPLPQDDLFACTGGSMGTFVLSVHSENKGRFEC